MPGIPPSGRKEKIEFLMQSFNKRVCFGASESENRDLSRAWCVLIDPENINPMAAPFTREPFVISLQAVNKP